MKGILTNEVINEQGETDAQWSDKRCSALFDSQHDDGHDKLSGQDGLEEKALGNRGSFCKHILGEKISWQDCGHQAGGSNSAEELHWYDADHSYPVEGTSNPETQGNL